MSNSFLPLTSQSLNAFEVLPENQIENWSFHLPLGFPIFFFLRQGYVHVTLISFPPFILSTFQLFFVVKYIRSLVLSFLRFVICLLKFTWDLVSQCLFLLYRSFLWHKFSFQKWIEYKVCSRSQIFFSFYVWNNCCTYFLICHSTHTHTHTHKHTHTHV